MKSNKLKNLINNSETMKNRKKVWFENILVHLEKQIKAVAPFFDKNEQLSMRDFEYKLYKENSNVKIGEKFNALLYYYDYISFKKSKGTHAFTNFYSLDSNASGSQMLAMSLKSKNFAKYCGLVEENIPLYAEVTKVINKFFEDALNFENSLNSYDENFSVVLDNLVLNYFPEFFYNKLKNIEGDDSNCILSNFSEKAKKIKAYLAMFNKLSVLKSFDKVQEKILELTHGLYAIPPFLKVKGLSPLRSVYYLMKVIAALKIYKKHEIIRNFLKEKIAVKQFVLAKGYGGTLVGGIEGLQEKFVEYGFTNGFIISNEQLNALNKISGLVYLIYARWNNKHIPESVALFQVIKNLCKNEGALWDGYKNKLKEKDSIREYKKLKENPFLIESYKFEYVIKPYKDKLCKCPRKRTVGNNKNYLTYRRPNMDVDFDQIAKSFMAVHTHCSDSRILLLFLENLYILLGKQVTGVITIHDRFFGDPFYAPFWKKALFGAYKDFYTLDTLKRFFPKEQWPNFNDLLNEVLKNIPFERLEKSDLYEGGTFVKH